MTKVLFILITEILREIGVGDEAHVELDGERRRSFGWYNRIIEKRVSQVSMPTGSC